MTYVDVDVLFPGTGKDFHTFKSLISSLSLTDTLLWCGRLNQIVSHPDISHLAQNFVADRFLDGSERARLESYLQRSGQRQFTLAFPDQLRELLRYVVLFCDDLPNDGETFEEPEVRRTFIKALLIASDVWSNRVQVPYLMALSENLVEGRERLMGPIRVSIEGTSQAMPLEQALGRGWALFSHYFPREDKGFLEAFRKATGMSLEDYLTALGLIAYLFNDLRARLQEPRNVLFNETLYRAVPEAEARVRAYLALEGQTAADLRCSLWGDTTRDTLQDFSDAPPFYFKPLRARPILLASGERAIILDLKFFLERAAIGPYFYVIDQPQASDRFGKAFERYTTDVLRAMYPETPVLVKRLWVAERQRTGEGEVEPFDACLNDGPEVVLFEITARFLKDDLALPIDPLDQTFLEHVWERYEFKLVQLVRNIENSILRNYRGEFSLCKVVYPVLLVQDSRFDAPMIGSVFQNRFQGLLAPDEVQDTGYMLKKGVRIAPLTILSIDDLEILEASVESFGLTELLRDYTREHPERLMSLYNHMAYSERYEPHLRLSDTVWRYHIDLYHRVRDLISHALDHEQELRLNSRGEVTSRQEP